MSLDAARRGTLDIKDPPLKAIVAANDNYEAGYHKGDVGGLDAIDAELATANIKSGITIFGKVGSADVQDISDATAIEAEVIAGETFYAVAGGIRTGTMPMVALVAGSNDYPAGYHAGAVGGLDAVDVDLVTANIKNGITIFDVAGSVDVRDVSDANALVGEVMNARTFYAVGGARKTGTLATRTLNPANETVQAGYYAGTTLSTVDVNLAAINILSGVNIFGFVGVATVQDIADANAILSDVRNGRTFYSVTGARKTGNLATVTLAAGSSAYPFGYHAGDVGGLPAIDADLATGNIKSGITIFNIAGSVDVRDVSDANLTVGEAPTGKTFYAVGGARKTGTGTKTLNAANEVVAAGYYAATTLSAVDAQLAAANILSGITIFGFTGPATVQDIADADAVLADVKNGKTFYSVTGGRKTGNLATVALAAGANAYPAGYHVGAANLTAVDGDLVAGNIANGITIFGVLGTLVAALAEDITGSGINADVSTTDGGRYINYSVAGSSDHDIATTTDVYDANSMTVAVGVLLAKSSFVDTHKQRLYMDGVQVAESAYFGPGDPENIVLVGTKALSGSKICKVSIHNYDVAAKTFQYGWACNRAGEHECNGAIGVGSIKLA